MNDYGSGSRGGHALHHHLIGAAPAVAGAIQSNLQNPAERPHFVHCKAIPTSAVWFTAFYPFSFTFLLRTREFALPILLISKNRTGVRGGIVEARAAAIDVAEAPDLAVSSKNHAWLCDRARHFGSQHGHRPGWI